MKITRNQQEDKMSSKRKFVTIFLISVLAAITGCEDRYQGDETVTKYWENTVHDGNLIDCTKDINPSQPNNNACPCAMTCQPESFFGGSGDSYYCAAKPLAREDCPPGSRFDEETSECVTTGVTDANEGTCGWDAIRGMRVVRVDIDDIDVNVYSHSDAVCGDGVCDLGENSENCPQDCDDGPPTPVCNQNGICQPGETPVNCPHDCGCDMDGVCEPQRGEHAGNCADCQDPDPIDDCGNGVCDQDETALSCPQDCDMDGDGYAVKEGDCDDNDPEVHPDAPELCDKKDNDCDGETDEGCPPEVVCGNGICEDGETVANCPEDCGEGVFCGDGQLNGSEQCDGSLLGGQTCQSRGYDGGTLGCVAGSCVFDTSGCYYDPDPEPYCGDGVKNGTEQCEGNDLGGNTCWSVGFDGGDLRCNNLTCAFNTSECFYNPTPFCGDGQINQVTEQCEGANLNGQSCYTVGFDSGNLACNSATCMFDTSGCYNIPDPYCGDGQINGSEQCDDGNLGGQTCQSRGFDGGELACYPNTCTFNTTGCFNDNNCGNGVCEAGETAANCWEDCGCGNGIINVGEQCDNTNLNNQTCQTLGYDGGTLYCFYDSCNFDTSSCVNDGGYCGDGVCGVGEHWGNCPADCPFTDDTTHYVAKQHETKPYCIDLNVFHYLAGSPEVFVKGDCPPLGLNGWDNEKQIFDPDGDGWFELCGSSNEGSYECKISFVQHDPNSANNLSWAQYGACQAESWQCEAFYGPYYHGDWYWVEEVQQNQYLGSIWFMTPSFNSSPNAGFINWD